MDPLSIIASTITIASLLRVALEKAQALRHSQTQLQALMSEGSALMIILLELEKCLSAEHATFSANQPQLSQKLGTYRNRLNDLTRRLGQWVDDSSAGRSKVETLALRGLRSPGKSRLFREELVALRAELSTVLLAFNT